MKMIQENMWGERMAMPQVPGESWAPPGVGPWLHAGKNSRASHSWVKVSFREIHTP